MASVLIIVIALASGAFADEYAPFDAIEVVQDEEGGGFGIRVGGISLWGCIEARMSLSASGLVLVVHSSKWQRRADENDSWADVPETSIEGVCGLPAPSVPGEYRWVADVEIDGTMLKLASGNTLMVAGDPDAGEMTAVEHVSWGLLKSVSVQ